MTVPSKVSAPSAEIDNPDARPLASGRVCLQTRVRCGYAANNLVVLRHIVLNLLRHDNSRKVSIKFKGLLACIEDEFREQLLGLVA